MQRVCIKRMLVIGILLMAVFISCGQQGVKAVEIGGELNVNSSLMYQEATDELTVGYSGGGELELYLPSSSVVESRLVLQSSLTPGDVDLGFKYLYIRKKFDGAHLTLGRQPVSWSSGAIINPYSYGFGVEGLAGETVTPGIDGLRYFHSLGQGRSLQLVTSFPQFANIKGEELGYGLRLRLPVAGYDLSLNYSLRPDPSDDTIRLGTTFKGDLGPVGAYGALGYYRAGSEDYLVQLGLDYSWQAGEYGVYPTYLQLEYLRFVEGELGMGQLAEDAFTLWPQMVTAHDLLVLNLSTRPDMFSSLGVAIIGESKEGSLLINPYYLTDLGGGLEIRTDLTLMGDSDNYSAGITAGFIYYF